MLAQPLRSFCLGTLAVTLLSGCSLVEPESEQIQVHVYDIYGPDQAASGDSLVFTLHGFAFDGSLRVGTRSERQAEVTAWAPKPNEPIGWCATPPLPLLGRFEAVMPTSGEYVLRAVQPDGTVLEKRVQVEGQARTSG